MRPARAIFIADRPDAVARLFPYFARTGFEIHVLAPSRSRLRWSRHTSHFVALAAEPAQRLRQLQEFASLVEMPRDIVVSGDDDILRMIANSDLDEVEKLSLLPISDARHLRVLGSKMGMAEVMREAGVDQPRFEIIDGAEVAGAVNRIGLPVLAKVDDGGGGVGVVILGSDEEVRRFALSSVGKEFLVEELVFGEPIGIEALYLNGNLCAMPASRALETMTPLGVSVVREFEAVNDMRLVEDLCFLGRSMGVHGFVNVSAIRRPDGSHCIFEFDLRPNSWHAYADVLGIDLESVLSALAGDSPFPETPVQVPEGQGVRIRNLTRTFRSGLRPRRAHREALIHPEQALPFVRSGDWTVTAIEGMANLHWISDHVRISLRIRLDRLRGNFGVTGGR